jgi:hypothetical protein
MKSGLVIGFNGNLQLIITTITIHGPIQSTPAFHYGMHLKSSKSAVYSHVLWEELSIVDIPILLGSPTVHMPQPQQFLANRISQTILSL